MSSSSGSASSTSRFIRPLLEWLFPLAGEELLAVYHGLIRKGAHLLVYGGLALLGFKAFSGSSRNLFKRLPFVSALLLVALVGSLDELNQSFNSARTGSAFDVLIDIGGGLIAGSLIAVRAVLGNGRPDRVDTPDGNA